MTEQQKNRMERHNSFWYFNLSIVRILLGPMVSAWLLYHICSHLGLFGRSTLFLFVIAPVLYLLWLTLLLSFYTLETTLLGLFWAKPRRLHQKTYGRYPASFAAFLVFYNRFYLVSTLPLVNLLIQKPVFKTLILRSYSLKTSIGREAFLGGKLWDPDLTVIGHNVVLGGDSSIVAHSLVRDENGLMVYQSAPIELGDYCTIGGEARIDMGAKIGARAIVQPRSHVRPFTIIPPDEVWGGNPATFISKREYVKGTISVDKGTADVCQLISSALETLVSKDSSVQTCLLWDSMGKMAIAAALYDRLGIELDAKEIFDLDSVQQIERLVAGKKIKAIASSEKKTSVVIAATFVAEPLGPSLKNASEKSGYPAEVKFCNFNQVAQSLLDPESPMAKNETGLNVVLARPEDLTRAMSTTLMEAIKAFAFRTQSAFVVGNLPAIVSEKYQETAELKTWWHSELEKIHGVRVFDFAGIVERMGIEAARNTSLESEASVPYSAALYQALGLGLARVVRSLHAVPKKVLTLDGDNTLWKGVIGEDGIEGVQVDENYKALQEAILELKQRGVLLALVSKNFLEDVERLFQRHPEMVLKRTDFAAVRVNWNRKSDNLRELAKELNLGLDSFVFLDDSPAEQLEVKANCPEVEVVALSNDAATYAKTLRNLGFFDGAGITDEDAKRTEFAAQESERKSSAANAISLDSYLASLELKVEVRKAREEDLVRVHQLVQKTNQFNLSLKRRSLPEIKALLPKHDIWVLSATDRFGDYGMVGCCISRVEKDVFELDTLLLSCRALGRGVEEAFLQALALNASKTGAKRMRAIYVKGPRNQPMELFLVKNGFDKNNELQLEQIKCGAKHLQLTVS